MNKILFFIIFLLPKFCIAQLPIDPETNEVLYQEVIEVENKTGEELYTLAKEWFVHAFVSANSVIQFDDKDNNTIIGKAYAKALGAINNDMGEVSFIVKIEAKDYRYRYTFSDFTYIKANIVKGDPPTSLAVEKPGGGILTIGNGNWRAIKNNVHLQITESIELLRNKMNKSELDDDW